MKTRKTSLGIFASWAAFTTVLCAMASISTVHAATTIVVTNTTDTGPDAPAPGSLRAALAGAADGDTIDATGITGTITLMSGPISDAELLVTKSVVILGPGPANLTIDANHLSRAFRIFPHCTVTISGLTISNGDAANAPQHGLGGGILNDGGSLTVSDCTLSGNSADRGGGIYNRGSILDATLTVANCLIRDNTADLRGGGLANEGSGGGDAEAAVINCTITHNSAFGGGGLYNETSESSDIATLTIDDTTISVNSAGNAGGGIFNAGAGAKVAVTGSTLSGNVANYGGGIINDEATLEVANCTFSGNSVGSPGGGAIYNLGFHLDAKASVTNSTLSGNTADNLSSGNLGGGLFNFDGVLNVGSTILKAGSPGVNVYNDGDGEFTSHGFNLSSDDGGGLLTAPTDKINTDPLLGPLADNGGPTRTHLPLSGSPAIDQGSSDGLATLGIATDQRGLARTVDDPAIANAAFGDGTDIGAVEAATPNHPPVAKVKNVTVLAGADGTASASIDDGSYDPDAGDTITLVQSPLGPYPIGSTLVTLTVTDNHGASSSATATVTVQGVADLSISKAVVSGQAKPGQVLIYTIVVKNVGPNAATDVVVTDAVPQGTTFASASPTPSSAPPVGAGGTVTWSVGNLTTGASVTLTLKVNVSTKGNSLIENTATVTSSSFDPNAANNRVTVTSKRNTK